MAVPFVIAAGLVVLAGAKVVSWIYNVKTEQEEKKQRDERKRSDEIRARASAASQRQEVERLMLLRQMGEEHSQFLLESIREHRLAVADVPSELDGLERMIGQEVADKTSSPYRKSALRREYARIEDAIVRMREYQRYLNQQESQIRSLLGKEAFEDLLGLDTTEPLLPVDWLYPGKLVLVSMDELGQPLPRFNHRISFGQDDTAQKTLALRYGDDIPVLVKSAHKRYEGLFYGCVARGALYYHHIMPGEPIEFVVERIAGPNAIGTFYEGIVRGCLPIGQLKHPGVRLLSGQKILVYPTAYDLCLNRNPFDEKSRAIEVSEFNYQARGVQSYQQLYLDVDERLLENISDARFYDTEEPWTLLGYSSTTGVISLAKASVQLGCVMRDDGEMLEVRTVTQTGTLQIGLDTPFRFTLIARRLARAEQVGWAYGVQEFLRFCAQAALDINDSPERLAQSRFYQRWEQVIAYQRSREENLSLEYPLELAQRAEGILTLQRNRLPLEVREQFDLVSDKLREVLSENNTLNPDYCVRLQHWDAKRSDYIPSLRFDRRNRPLYTRQKDSIGIEGNFSLLDNDAQMLRLLVSVPSASLKRQSQALDDFFQDRLVNPALKNILLAPEHYLPEQEERSAPIAWASTLDDSQKRVVELALRERNIALIQGPPGAGKTTAIVEMLYQLFCQRPNRRVLVVSQQNTAVDNALGKFLDKHGNSLEQPIQAIRIGNPEKMSSAIQPLGFDRQHADFLAELDARAIEAAVRLPEAESNLCHVWRATLKQATQSRAGQDEFFITLLADRNLVGATCVGLATNKGGIDQLQFDVAIIDEAGRATVPEILIPILRSRKVILVGDHYQLPPSIAPLLREDEATQALGFLRENFLSGSFFELMFERLPAECREVLDKQYRMAPPIGDLVANLFYSREGQRTLFNGHPDSHFEKSYLLDESIYWVDVKGRQQQPHNSMSQENVREAEEITGFLIELADKVNRLTSVAVITPYGAQKERVRRQLRNIGWQNGQLGPLSIEVDTVDAFQGSEADVVCYSTVRTEGGLNFILDRKRLNVACSRAKLHLLFFGDSQYLSSWRAKGKDGFNLFPEIMKHASTAKVGFRKDHLKASMSEADSSACLAKADQE
ncbi:hypothetical protein VNPA152081_38540 [Pseudomonas aeruginosa]|uniref:DEAD/DEAH box helicase n=1 Tax=Pseudomonas aeruginosa TaxID=287 RepID=UPI0021E1AF3F|nr:AAA domain-containing protein [Pseudomonas aeruginosa]GLF60028.1 hypothetical protein VNPA141826_41890 [Pseudomonas aeruginosa]GLF78781.1 hypothetical protein VNPA152081_38540 [Pseudomonas aeruginosa]HCE0302616.1 AAA family ATPase [Pseudomonas aeruginosa]HCE3809342.1 AAA family ATPase [Pseudomonas aeruginosa]HCL3794484.1 AAA family ATPase [Pseudomonas aeruginosa]